jgi:hypothetical protein
MWQDPFVTQIRCARKEHARRFGYDLQTIYAVLKEQEEQGGCNKVSLPPKRIPPVKDTEQGPTA